MTTTALRASPPGNNMRNLLLIMLLPILTAISAQAQTVSYNGTKPAFIIDVRTPAEFAAGHIEGAINIPLDRIGTGIHTIKRLNPQSQILLYCRSGRRSAAAREILKQQGFSKVMNGGGMTALSEQLKPCDSKRC